MKSYKAISLILCFSTPFLKPMQKLQPQSNHKICTAVYAVAAGLGVSMIACANWKSYIDWRKQKNNKLNKAQVKIKKPDVQKLVKEFLDDYAAKQKHNLKKTKKPKVIVSKPQQESSKQEKGLIKDVIDFVKHTWKAYKQKDLAIEKTSSSCEQKDSTAETLEPPSAEAIAAYVKKHEEAYLRQCYETKQKNKAKFKTPSSEEFFSTIPGYKKHGHSLLRSTGWLITLTGTAAAIASALTLFEHNKIKDIVKSLRIKEIEKYCPCCMVKEMVKDSQEDLYKCNYEENPLESVISNDTLTLKPSVPPKPTPEEFLKFTIGAIKTALTNQTQGVILKLEDGKEYTCKEINEKLAEIHSLNLSEPWIAKINTNNKLFFEEYSGYDTFRDEPLPTRTLDDSADF